MQVCAVPGGYGVIATRDYEPGDIIFSEKPAVVFSLEEFSAGLLSKGTFPPAVLKLHDQYVKKGGKKTMSGVVRTNWMGTNKPSVACLCIKLARVNHSCAPNCINTWDDNTKTKNLYAIKTITVGDALSFSYIENTITSTKNRRDNLKTNFGFKCVCSLCSCEDTATSDRRRNCCEDLQYKLAMADDPKRGMTIATELIALFKEEGIINPFVLVSTCYNGFHWAVMMKKAVEADSFIRKASACAMIAYYDGHPLKQKYSRYINNHALYLEDYANGKV